MAARCCRTPNTNIEPYPLSKKMNVLTCYNMARAKTCEQVLAHTWSREPVLLLLLDFAKYSVSGWPLEMFTGLDVLGKVAKMLGDLVTIGCKSIIKACKSSLPRCNRASCFHVQLQPPRQLPLKGLLLLAPSSSTSWPSFLRKIWDLLDEKSWHESPGLVLWKRKTNKQKTSTKLLDFKIWNQVSAILLKLLAFQQVLAPGFLAMQLWELLYLWHFHQGKGRRHSSVPSWRRTKIPSALPIGKQGLVWATNVPNVESYFKKPTNKRNSRRSVSSLKIK